MSTVRSRPILVFALEARGRVTPILTDGRRRVRLRPLPRRYASLAEAVAHLGSRFPGSPVVTRPVGRSRADDTIHDP
jgi:hypothetical protein